jgi:hypothetical protein
VKVGPGARACLSVSASVLLFALLIENAGLLPAILATVLVAAHATGAPRLRDTVVLALGIAAGVALLFLGLLGQPVPLIAWP